MLSVRDRCECMLPKNERLVASSFVFIDTLIILVSYIGVHRAYFGNFNFTPERLLILIFTIAASYFAMVSIGLYRPDRGFAQNREIQRVLWAWTVVVLSVGLFAFAVRISNGVPRIWVGSSALLAFSGMAVFRLSLRMFLRHARKKGLNIQSIAVVGIDVRSLHMARHLAAAPWKGLAVKAMFYVDQIDIDQRTHATSSGVRTIKPLDELGSYIENRRSEEQAISQVWLALPIEFATKMEAVCETLKDSSVDVCYLPDSFSKMLIEGEVTDYGEMSLVNISSVRKFPFAEVVKRGFDFVFALIVLILIMPLLLGIAIAIRFDSSGPVIFQQRRYGMNGQVIKVWKFRTMKVLEDGPVVRQAQRNDPRITRIGAVLRNTSLDELPQFINVLQGRMSVVGPRPHPVAHNEEFRKKISGYMMRHKFKPGITGWAQVNGLRGETNTLDKMQKRVDYDLQYIRNWSVWFDIKIILMTIFKGFSGKNVY